MSTTEAQRLARLGRCLDKFRATPVPEGYQFFTHHRSTKVGLYEQLPGGSLGKGGFAEGTYKVRAANSEHQPILVCKTMKKLRMAEKEETIVQLCAEIAVLHYVAPDCPKLNRSVGVFHDATNVYLLLSTVDATQATLETRLAHIYAHFGNAKKLATLPRDVEIHAEQWHKQAKSITEQQKKDMQKKPPRQQKYAGDNAKEEESSNEVELSAEHTFFVDNIVASALRSPTLRGKNTKESRVFGNLLQLLNEDYTFTRGRQFREAKAKVLEGLWYLHGGPPCEQCQHDQCGSKKSAGWVHRDLKLANVIVGISRTSTFLKEHQGVITGVQFREKIEVQIIDFGLAKHVVPEGATVTTPSPGHYGQTVASATTAGGHFPATTVSGGARPPAQPPSPHAARHTFTLPVTPNGTWKGWMALQGLVGVFDKHLGERADDGGPLLPKWWSTSEELPKFDIWGAGAIFFTMTHGEMPFEPLGDTYTDEEILQDLIAKVRKGREPDQSLEEGTRRLITAMLHNDPKQRPTAAESLNDVCFADVTDTFVYNMNLRGEYSPVVLDTPLMAAAGPPMAEGAVRPSSDDEGVAPREEAQTSSDGATDSTLSTPVSDDDEVWARGLKFMERLMGAMLSVHESDASPAK